jgi:two-component system response regulator FixJ
VLDGVVEGHVNKVIANNLDISVRTVEVHRSRVMKKLGIKTASEAVKMVLLSELVSA